MKWDEQAAEFRYEDIPGEVAEPFDRHWAMECVERTRKWVESLFA